MKVPSLEIGKQLQVGAGEAKSLGKGVDVLRGSAYIEGPLQVGDDESFDDETPVATVMIGPDENTDIEEHAKRSLHVKGNVKIDGNDLTSNALNIVGDTDQTGNMNISGDITTGGDLTVGGFASWSGSIVATTKLFDIKHPTKEGKRLAHGCLEGPEHAVYVRGRVCNGKNTIDLPEYWDGLIDYETITVQLTCLGSHQNVIVKRISPVERKVYLQSQGGMPVDAFYHIMAQRKDVNDLVVEYEGSSLEESPNV
tara:strand:- start:45 stop:806 length:762 start_codon:yes stop_codon:yes gene_type:complete